MFKTSSSHLTQAWQLDNSYTCLPEYFYTHIRPTPVRAPKLVILNYDLASSLGLSFKGNDDETLAQIFSGNVLLNHSKLIAQAYAGHQFGHFTLLGDGRAHLLGEHVTADGKRYDIQLKGSGQTPYSRRADGRAALGPMLREYLISEAMHALRIPTTRSLAVVTTGEPVYRNSVLQGAILTRVAASHLRVGTFEFATTRKDYAGLKALADYAIKRHYPELHEAQNPYLDFLNAVIKRQAELVAAWMHVGFVHGVMNTDNMSISGETIDYGPCAFLDRFAIDAVFSSIDHHGRYAFGNQASIAQWNLLRLAEAMLPLLHTDPQQATLLAEEAMSHFADWFNKTWLSGMRKKIGLFNAEDDDLDLIQTLLQWMQATGADYTATFHQLAQDSQIVAQIDASPNFQNWQQAWQARLTRQVNKDFRAFMQTHNPFVIPRNQHVEDALRAAEDGDLNPFLKLLQAIQNPFAQTPENAYYQRAPAHTQTNYQTFCGT